MQLEQLRARWKARLAEFEKLRAQVDGAEIIRAFIADLDASCAVLANELLTVADAANETGYSEEHLRRSIRSGAIPNAGRPGAPLVRRTDLPTRRRRTARLLETPPQPILRSKGQIARRLIEKT